MSESLQSSLPVPSVQEIARQAPDTVPERYIRDDVGYSSDLLSPSVPVIDLSELVNSESNHHEQEFQNLHSACRDWGIFQLINHGISGERLSSMRKGTEEFFALPLEEKKRWGQEAGGLEGYGQVFVTSEGQKLEWNDMIFLKALPDRNMNSRLWPQLPHNLTDALENYSVSVRDSTVCLVKIIGKALGIEATELEQSLMDGNYEVRLNCYPPCAASDRVIGMSPHADMSGITVLLECGDEPGLQVLKDGKWVFLRPMQDAIVVNLGQILQVVSNGIYNAPEHRALVNRRKERLSVVTFCYPNPSAIIGPAKELVRAETPALYKTLSVEDYFRCFYNRKLDAPFIDALRL